MSTGALLRHLASGAAVDRHLADQLLLPLSVAAKPSRFTVEQATRDLETNAWVIRELGVAEIVVHPMQSGTVEVVVAPQAPRIQT